MFIKMSTAGARLMVICGGIVLSASPLVVAGEYQLTKDGKTLVWNDSPQAGDAASWSGSRDGERYATGFGTLTWYSAEKDQSAKPILYARFFGNMVRGRLNGPVNVHFNNNKTGHAVFVEGRKATGVAAGPVRSWKTPPLQVPQATPAPERTVPEAREEPEERRESKRREEPKEPEAPAEGPMETPEPPALPDPGPPAPVTFAGDVDDSLRVVAWPPTSLLRTLLRIKRVAGAPAETMRSTVSSPRVVNPRRAKDEVIFLADAALRRSGKNPADYDRAEPQYEPADGAWLVLYDRKSDDAPEHAAVAVGDRTAQTSIVIGR